MTISEMHQNFKISADKVDSLNFPEFLPEEIDSILNTAIERFISQRAYGNNPRREGLEETQKRFDDLLTLISTSTITTLGTSPLLKPGGYSASLPTDYWHAIQEEVSITYTDCNSIQQTIRIPVVPVTHERYNRVINDPFNKPSNKKLIRLGLSNAMELVTDGNTTINAYYLRYIRKPAVVQYGSTYAIPTIDTNCDLPEHTHQEIVSMSRSIALGLVEKNTQAADRDLVTQE